MMIDPRGPQPRHGPEGFDYDFRALSGTPLRRGNLGKAKAPVGIYLATFLACIAAAHSIWRSPEANVR
jgi:hypothetical protein